MRRCEGSRRIRTCTLARVMARDGGGWQNTICSDRARRVGWFMVRVVRNAWLHVRSGARGRNMISHIPLWRFTVPLTHGHIAVNWRVECTLKAHTRVWSDTHRYLFTWTALQDENSRNAWDPAHSRAEMWMNRLCAYGEKTLNIMLLVIGSDMRCMQCSQPRTFVNTGVLWRVVRQVRDGTWVREVTVSFYRYQEGELAHSKWDMSGRDIRQKRPRWYGQSCMAMYWDWAVTPWSLQLCKEDEATKRSIAGATSHQHLSVGSRRLAKVGPRPDAGSPWVNPPPGPAKPMAPPEELVPRGPCGSPGNVSFRPQSIAAFCNGT